MQVLSEGEGMWRVQFEAAGNTFAVIERVAGKLLETGWRRQSGGGEHTLGEVSQALRSADGRYSVELQARARAGGGRGGTSSTNDYVYVIRRHK